MSMVRMGSRLQQVVGLFFRSFESALVTHGTRCEAGVDG